MRKKTTKKPTVNIATVSWTNGRALKRQAAAEMNGVRIWGNPARDDEAAIKSLESECRRYLDLAQLTLEELDNKGKEADDGSKD